MPQSIFTILDFLLDNSNQFYELSDLQQYEIENLKTLNNSINKKELYEFVYHGLHHSQKVMLFAYLIGKHEGLNESDMKILMDASIYHDSGRIDESEDQLHGLYTAQKFDKIFTDEFYNDNVNLSIIRAICEGHSRDDKWKRLTFDNYEIDEKYYDRYSKLYDALKDADALDRARFPKSTKESIKEEFLRLNYSKSLVDFSFLINRFYRNVIDRINYNKYSKIYNTSEIENACLHGIGWDFAKLESILEHGILSNFAATDENIPISRNFEGNNSNMWISVIDSADVQKNGEAYSKFIKNNIMFYAFCSKYNSGVKSKSQALSEGLPIRTGLYEDESFVFDRINKENIYAFILPKDSLEIPLKDLNYLSCSHNFSVINNMVNHYYDYITKTCGVELDRKMVEQLILKLKEKQIQFGKLSDFEQNKNLNSFFEDTDKDVANINNEIATWMSSSFKVYFGTEEEPSVKMLIQDIVKKKGIGYEIKEPDEIIYRVNLQEKKIVH